MGRGSWVIAVLVTAAGVTAAGVLAARLRHWDELAGRAPNTVETVGVLLAGVILSGALAVLTVRSLTRLARDQQLAELVRERNEELESSHERLRTTERLASIGTLTAGLGHDMNNVLFPIRCRLDALDWADVPEVLIETLRSTAHTIEYLQQLSDGLRLFALDPDDAEASASQTLVPAWWEQVSPLMRKTVAENVTLVDRIPMNLPPVRVAMHRLTQAVFNLVINASDAMPDGGRVTVWADADQSRSRIRIGVSDEGVGMHPDVQRRVLDPFFTTKPRGLSTGLGLSLVHGVASAARGELRIDSVPGIGTTVELELPVGTRDDTHDFGVRRCAGDAIVLVADDLRAAWIASVLRSSGHTVHREARNGTCRPTVVVCDTNESNLLYVKKLWESGCETGVIAIGSERDEWVDLGASIVEDAGSLVAVRSAIDSVMHAS